MNHHTILPSSIPNLVTIDDRTEDAALRNAWFRLSYYRYEEDKFLRGVFAIALPASVNTLQTVVGYDGNIMERANAILRAHSIVRLRMEETRHEHEGRWVAQKTLVLRLSRTYVRRLQAEATGGGDPRKPYQEEVNGIDMVWNNIVRWVTELCWTRPVPLDEWFLMNARVGQAGISPDLTVSHKADAMTMLGKAWELTRSNEVGQLMEGNAFFSDRAQAIGEIQRLLNRALHDMHDPVGAAKALLTHWLAECPLVERAVLEPEDCLALSVHVWKGELDTWIGRLQPWGWTPVDTGIDEWARHTKGFIASRRSHSSLHRRGGPGTVPWRMA